MLPPVATIHFRNLWTDRTASAAARLADEVTVFDRREGNQLGIAGYMARLDRLLAEHIEGVSRDLVDTLFQVHRAFKEPLSTEAEAMLLQLAQSALTNLREHVFGYQRRHLSGIVASPALSHAVIDHADALAQVYALNTLRQRFWTLRNVPGEIVTAHGSAAPAPASLLPSAGADRATPEALASLRARIDRLAKTARLQVAEGFKQVRASADGSSQAYSFKGLKSPEQLEDELLSLFVWVWSLKDYLKGAYRDRGWKEQDVEGFVNTSLHLQLVSDLANKAKHATLTKSRSGEWAELIDVGWTVPQSAISSIQVGAASVHVDVHKAQEVVLRATVRLKSGAEFDAFQVLDRAVVDWESGPVARLAVHGEGT
jgi:hypothetical protein